MMFSDARITSGRSRVVGFSSILITGLVAWTIALQALPANIAWADSVAEFDYRAEDFNFSYEGQMYQTDVFDNLKNVMPGDVRRQCVEIRNAATNPDDVKIYFTVKAIGENDYAFFDKMDLKIEEQGVSEPLYEGSCAKQALMPDGVYLGTLSPGESTHIDVTLTASADMDDAYQGASGTSYGAFTAEVIGADESLELPIEQVGGKILDDAMALLPQTGDGAGMLFAVITLAILVSGVMLIWIEWRRP